jgi:hypothetical protein
MAKQFRNYAVLLFLLALTVAVLIYGIIADSANAAFFLNGVMLNVPDPVNWIVALPFAAVIRRDWVLLLALFIIGSLFTVLKVYLHWMQSTDEFVGLVPGSIVGFLIAGYIINAIVVYRRGRRGLNDPPRV